MTTKSNDTCHHTETRSSEARRILVIDDQRAIHDDFQNILLKEESTNESLASTRALLFGDTEEETSADENLQLDSAYQGEEGVELVRKALEEGNPYSTIFVDMRMPPGIDGVETTKRIWEVDPDANVVLCTAYSDYSWEETIDILGNPEQLLVLKKPFEIVEIRQLANSLVRRWQNIRKVEVQLAELGNKIRRSREIACQISDVVSQRLADFNVCTEDLQGIIKTLDETLIGSETLLEEAKQNDALAQLASELESMLRDMPARPEKVAEQLETAVTGLKDVEELASELQVVSAS